MNLADFASWAIENSAFGGCDLDGGSVQEKAVACGLLVEVKYDPKKHGGSAGAETGDPWFVFSDDFRAFNRLQATDPADALLNVEDAGAAT